MKKLILLLAVFMVAAGAFAQDIKISAGVQIDYNFFDQGYGLDASNEDLDFAFSIVDVSAFLDITYAVFSISYAFNIGGPSVTYKVDGEKDDTISDDYTDAMENIGISYLNITALGKYPFDLGGVTIFPMVGLEYQLNLSVTDDGEDQKDGMSDDELAALNDLYILAGVGADFNITESLYARVIALFGYNLTPDSQSSIADDADSEWGWIVRAGVAVGYKF